MLICPYCPKIHTEILLAFILLHRYLVFFSFQIGCDMGMTNLIEILVALYLVKVQYFCSRPKGELGSPNTYLFLLTWPIDQVWSTTSHKILSSQNWIISGHVTFFLQIYLLALCHRCYFYIFLLWFFCYWISQILVFTDWFIIACFFLCMKGVGVRRKHIRF